MEITEIKPGMKFEAFEQVTETKTATVMGSGALPVYATPAMMCLMEKAASDLAELYLPEGWTSVGIKMEAAHEAPTPVGVKVRAEAVVKAVEGRKIVYEVRAYDAQGEIGKGVHERFAVQAEKFLANAETRKAEN